MSDLRVPTEELRATSTKLTAGSTRVRDAVRDMTRDIGTLRTMFSGPTATRLEDRWLEWERSSEQLSAVLDALGQFLNDAAARYDETEAANVRSLG